MKPTRLFKGPLFPRKSNATTGYLGHPAPMAHGNIDEEDFSTKAGRPTRKDLEVQRKSKEDHRGEK